MGAATKGQLCLAGFAQLAQQATPPSQHRVNPFFAARPFTRLPGTTPAQCTATSSPRTPLSDMRTPNSLFSALALALAFTGPLAQAASLSITPSSDVRSLRQISVRFDTPMTALGQSNAPAPANVSCTHPNATTALPAGSGRWVNERDWAYEFQSSLPAGTQCRISPQANLQSLAGVAVSSPGEARFAVLPLGFYQLLTQASPGKQADYALLVQHPHPAGGRQSLAGNPFVCDVLDAKAKASLRGQVTEGNAQLDAGAVLRTLPTALLSDAQVRERFKSLAPHDDSAVAMRCAGDLPDGATVRVRRQRDVDMRVQASAERVAFASRDTAGQERFAFDTRAPFTATLACEQPYRWRPMPHGPHRPARGPASTPASDGLACDVRLPIELNFSSPVRFNAGAMPQLLVKGVAMRPTPSFSDESKQLILGLRWRINPADVPSAQGTRLQGGAGITDLEGRPLANPDTLQIPVQLLPPPPYLNGMANSGTIVPSKAVPGLRRLSFATRGLEPQLAVSQWHLGAIQTDAQLLAAAKLVAAIREPNTLSDAEWNALLAQLPAPQAQTLTPSSTQIELASLPLAGAGLHVARVRSPIYDTQVRRQQAQRDAAAGAGAGAASGSKPAPPHPGDRWNVAQLSNLGVTANLGAQGESLLWVTAIDSARPVGGARVWLYDYCMKPLWQGQTDAQGVARVPESAPRIDHATCDTGDSALRRAGSLWVRVQTADDMLLTPLAVGHFGDVNTPSAWLAHLVLDRSLLQAGETLHMQLLARKPTAKGYGMPTSKAVRISIRHESGDEAVVLPGNIDESGQLSLQWTLPANAKLGRYDVTATAPGNHTVSAHASFRLEEFRRPVFDANLTTVLTPGERQLRVNGKLVYFSGGSAAGERVQWQHRWSPEIDAPVPGYTFFTATQASDLQPPAPLSSAPSTLGADGTARAELTLPALSRPWRIDTEMRFNDPNGETQTVASHGNAWPTALRMGLAWQVPTATQAAHLAGVLVNAQGKPVAGRAVQMQFSTAQSVHVARTQPGESSHWKSTGHVKTLCQAVTNRDGKWQCPWPAQATPEGDRIYNMQWLIRAQLADQPAVQVALPVSGWQVRAQGSDDDLVVLNGTQFKAGDTAQIEARAQRLPASLLLTTEREGVRSHQVIALNQPKQRIDLPLLAHDAPNIHVRAQYVYPLLNPASDAQKTPAPGHQTVADETATAASLYQHQVVDLAVAPNSFALSVRVSPTATEVRPQAKLPVKLQVRDAQGRPAANAQITVAVVDEALLALQPNPTWQLTQAMWRPRENSVGTRSVLPNVALHPIEALAADWIAPDEVAQGGSATAGVARMAAPASPAPSMRANKAMTEADARTGPSAPPVRSDFSSLLLWQTQVRTDAHGMATVSVPVNDSLTRFRVVALATHGADQFGEGDSQFTVTQPLQIVSGLPEVLRAGDDIVQKLTLRNTGTRAMAVSLTAQATPTASDSAPPARALADAALQERGLRFSRQITLKAGESQSLVWRLRVPDGVSQLQWRFVAQGKGANGAERDALSLAQRVLPAIEPTVRAATLLQLDGSAQTLAVAQPAGALPLVGGVRVGLSASLVDTALQETRRWMRDYPYACLEQRSSRAVVLNEQAEWDRLMALLPKYLDAQGFARFFPEASLAGSEMLTLQLLDLSRATGWAIPADSRARMLQAMQAVAARRVPLQDWAPNDNPQARQLAAQATLAEQGAITLSALPEDLSTLSNQSLIDWARTLAALPAAQRPAGAVGDPARVSNQLRTRFDVQGSTLRWRDEASTNWWWFMWSGDSSAAHMALLAQQLGGQDAQWQADAPRIVQGLVARQQRGRWYTTSANVWSAVALQQFAQQREAGAVSGASALKLGSTAREVVWQDQKAPPVLLPWPAQGSTEQLHLQQLGTGKPWATVATVAAVPLTAPVAHGLAVKRDVFPVSQRKPGQWAVGDSYRVRLSITSNAPQTWVVVRDALPSGATPLSRGLGRDSAMESDPSTTARDWRNRPSFEEHAADSYRAYYRWVSEGSWQVEYTVRLNNAGRFELPPTRVEAMYAPEVFGETPAMSFEVAP